MSNKSLIAAAAFAVLLLAGNSALAQQAQATGDVDATRVATLGDLDIHQSNEMLYKAKTAEAKAKAELDKYADSQDGQKAGAGSTSSTADVESELPTFTDVFGGAQGNRAEFLYPNHTTATGGKGEKISGGYTVVDVSLNDVSISKNGKVYHLGRGNAAAMPRAQQQGPQGFPLSLPPGSSFPAPPSLPTN